MSDDLVSITCNAYKGYYSIGEIAVLILKGHGNNALDNAVIFGQVHGHLSTDSRWIKSPSAPADAQTSQHGDNFIPLNPNSAQQKSSHCCFSTSRVTVSPTHLYERGLVFEFEVPQTCVPSFRGLAGTVTYYVSLTIQSPAFNKQLHFPLVFNGSGGSSSSSSPYSYSCLVCYPVSSLPLESYYADVSSKDDSLVNSSGSSSGTIFNIKDKGHICKIHLRQDSVRPGQDVSLVMDFSDSVQGCLAVKASLIQKETRGDGSRIQDKTMLSVVRDTQEALHLQVQLPVPPEAVCSFECPLFRVFYQIEVEFCLYHNGDQMDGSMGMFDNAFSFTSVIPVTATHAPLTAVEGTSAAIERQKPNRSVIQAVHSCLESSNVLFPVLSN